MAKDLDIHSLSKEELQERLKTFYASPYINVYFAVKNQMDNLSKQIEEAKIRFDDEDKLFDAFIKFGDKFEKISNSLETIRQKIDKETLEKEKDKRLSAKAGSVESFIKGK